MRLSPDTVVFATVLVLGTTLATTPRAQAPVGPDTGGVYVGSDTVAVVPFTNISGQSGDDWIGVGIAETVTADLEHATTLSIIGQETLIDKIRTLDVELSSPADQEVLRLGHDLGVEWLVAGGYQRLRDRVRITARLIEVESGAVNKTVKIDGGLDEIFALQDRVVAELSDGLWFFERGQTPTQSTNLTVTPVVSTGPAERDTVTHFPRAAIPPLVPGDVTGTITIDDTATFGDVGRIGAAEPHVGVATRAGALSGRPSVRVARASAAPNIDGRLDDSVWTRAARITDFVQTRPLDGAPASEATDVYIAYDSENLYFGLHAHYSDTALIRANRSDRDATFEDDTISVYFDPFLDQQRAYVLSVNGYGVQADSLTGALGGGGRRRRGGGGSSSGSGGNSGQLPIGDPSWDALFDSGGTLVEDGWTAEMAIPFKSLRYPRRASGEQHQWGFQIVRSVHGKDETDVWAPISRDVAGFMTQMGVLEGITNLSTSRTREILPTLTGIQFGSLNPATGQFERRDAQPEGGMNFKYGITSELTADLTYNPDFSQVESDLPQIEVNQRYALFYPELRPFFLEGAEIFDLGGAVQFIHTRTLVDPRYGGKITGKVGKTTLGLLVADDEAPGNVDDVTNPAYGRTAQVFVGRVRYDLYAESHVGAIVTDREFLDTYSRVGGVDAGFRLGRTHRIGVKLIQSQHRDSTGAERSGPMFHFGIGNRGRHLSYFMTSDILDPDFKTDTGFVRRVDMRQVQGNVAYRWWPEDWLINWGPRFNYGRNYDFDDALQDEKASLGLNAIFAKNISVNAAVNRDMERFNQIDFFKTTMTLNGNINSSRYFSVGGGFQWGEEISFTENPFLGHMSQGGLFMTLRPSSRLTSDVIVRTSRFLDLRKDGEEVFDVKIFRSFTTYQFTERLLFRNITEYNTFDRALGLNVLFTYRVNAGTAFFIGYDDHYQQGSLIDDKLFPVTTLKRTNQAFFTKVSYLLRF